MLKDVFMIGQHLNYIADYCLNFIACISVQMQGTTSLWAR